MLVAKLPAGCVSPPAGQGTPALDTGAFTEQGRTPQGFAYQLATAPVTVCTSSCSPRGATSC